ncbi:unnamed protein product [Caenorhabditis auriculariae]|uniref:Cation/H+ exchanger transmembrane domain-containing protein n=1 Tax=Caenorhabditis auriculariae TaxID=2777116 RepID=A0A8S1GQU4_9PELO|nr:unnamed protein product [Caenorhabditis auriculariae]
MQCVSKMHNNLHSFFNNREVNSIVTALFVFIGLYISIITVLGQSFWHPLQDGSLVSDDNAAINVRTILVVFFILTMSLAAGGVAHIIRLPPLLGSLVLGIFLRNVPILHQIFVIPPYWDAILRKIAFVNVVVCWALSTNLKFLNSRASLPLALGILTPIGEALALGFGAYFILGLSEVMSVLCGLILAAVSPASTVVTINRLKNEFYLNNERTLETITAATNFDSFSLCIGCSSHFIRFIFRNSFVFGVIAGVFLGWLFWRFPRSDAPHMSLARTFLIATYSIGLVIGSYFLLYPCAGLVGGLLMGAMASARWGMDNDNKGVTIVTTFKYMWEIVSSPLLFALLGRKFDCSTLTWESVFLCLGLIAIGIIVRIVLVMLVTACFSTKFKEQVVICLSMLPRAAIQADLGPTLVALAFAFPQYIGDANIILRSCILTALFTAPLFELLLSIAAPRLLNHMGYEDDENQVPVKPTSEEIHSTYNNSSTFVSRFKAISRDSETVVERY